jgi:hypothetical protein
VKKRVDLKGSFEAYNAQGVTRWIYVYVDILDVSSPGNPNSEIEGLRNLRTKSGHHVNRIDKGKYQVVETGEMLTSDDPLAA